MAKKKLTAKQKVKLEQKKAEKRIVRRLKTLEKHGIELKRSATKRTAKRYIELNKDQVDWHDADSIKDLVDSVVNSTKYFDRKSDTAREFKKQTGMTFKDLEHLDGGQVHDAIAQAIDKGMSREDALKAFGY